MSAQSSASLRAIRVKSRNPAPASSAAAAGAAASEPANANASRWGRWLTQATSASCCAAVRRTTRAPSASQNATTRAPAAGSDASVTMQTERSNRSARACAMPRWWLPAIGCEPT